MNIFTIGMDSQVVSALIQSKLDIELKNLDGFSLRDAYLEILKTRKEDYVFYNTPIDFYIDSILNLDKQLYATREELKKFEMNLSATSIGVFCIRQNPYLHRDYVESPIFQRQYELYSAYFHLARFENKFKYDLNQKDDVLATLLIDKIRNIKKPPLMPRPSEIQTFKYREDDND